MKILWLTTFDENTFGHTELFGLAQSLINKGHTVIVIGSSTESSHQDKYLVYINKPFNSRTFFQIKLALLLPWLVVSAKPDFIIVEWQSASLPIFLIPLIKLGLYQNNLIHDIRTIPVNDFDQRRVRHFGKCINMSKRNYLGITTITPALKNKLCSEFGISAERIGVWSSGVDTSLFYPRGGETHRKLLGIDQKFVVFYHGSVGYRRGVVEVVEAMSLLKNKSQNICLFILGSGLEIPTIRQIVENEGLHNVYIHPPVGYGEIPSYIAMADVCIVPLPDIESWRVSSPLKVMEYLAMGKPIILTDIIAHREIIQEDGDAFFVKDVQPETLAAAIEKAYSMKTELPKMGESGRRIVERSWTWDIQAERLIEYLRSRNNSSNGAVVGDSREGF